MIHYDHEPRILAWKEVEPIFGYYLNVWDNHIPMNWASLAWNALMLGGKCLYQNDEEEMLVRSYAVAISLIYYEYCMRSAWHKWTGFKYWSDDIIETIKRDFLNDTDKIGDALLAVNICLQEQIGEEELPFELWVNCQESYHQHVFSTSKKISLFSRYVRDQIVDISYERGYAFTKGDDIIRYESYEGVSGL